MEQHRWQEGFGQLALQHHPPSGKIQRGRGEPNGELQEGTVTGLWKSPQGCDAPSPTACRRSPRLHKGQS
eukprot:c29027_g1_i2 orf=133-342(-)